MRHVQLNLGQRAALADLFRQLEAAHARGEPGAIVAQVYEDGLVCRTIEGDKCKALAAALKKDSTAPAQTYYSASEHFTCEMRRIERARAKDQA